MDLDELLIAAAEAPPESRIEYRDRIAAYGDAAIDRLMAPSWIGDPSYSAFAIQTIRKAGELGAARSAVEGLRRALSMVLTDWHRRDVETALGLLGASMPRLRARATGDPRPRSVTQMSLDDLTIDRCYRRSELHDGGLGGNRQKGISYPATGTHCLLFSDPSKDHVHGYRDRPSGENRYRYFGEWSGTGDMVLTGGNKAIVDRSPELYLFTAAPCGYVFRGRFQLISSETETTTRDGRQFNAIVFNLERIDHG